MIVESMLCVDIYEIIYAVCAMLVLYGIYTNIVCVLAAFGLYICVSKIYRLTAGRVEINGQGIIITGCDTGFGHDLARRLDDLGFTVFAGCLKPEEAGARKLKSGSSKRLHVFPLDVGADEAFEKAHAYVVKHMPKNGIWAIVSNAGFNVMGDVEWLTVNLYNKVMNVNFYGAIRLFRRFLYLVRQSKGRVVVVTSVKGKHPWPSDSAYHATKYALETTTDSLRLEMKKFDVKVSIVEPGNFSTATACQNVEHFKRYRQEADEMWDSAGDDARMTYGRDYLDNMIARQEQSITGSALTTEPVIDALVDAITNLRPQTHYLVDGGKYGWDPFTTFPRYHGYLPTWLSDRIIAWWTECHIPPVQKKEKSE